MNLVVAEALAHKDVRGKEQFYIKFTNGKSEYVINVGKKTFEEVVRQGEENIHYEADKHVREQ